MIRVSENTHRTGRLKHTHHTHTFFGQSKEGKKGVENRERGVNAIVNTNVFFRGFLNT